MNILKNEKGGYSIETAIVMTISFTVIMFLIFMTFVMYEQVRLTAIAQDTAQRGAVIYAVNNKEMITGRIEGTAYNDQNPYWRILDIGSNNSRLNRIKDYLELKLNANRLGEPYVFSNNPNSSGNNYSVTLKNYFLYKRICVDINVEYKVPFGGLFNMLIKNPYPIKAHAEATVSEPAEFIRTLDLGSDIISNFLGTGGDNKYKAVIQKALNWINNH